MRVLIGNPPWRQGDMYGIRSGCRFPYMTNELTAEGVPTWIPFPFTHAQAAALLLQNGFEAEFWDGVASGGTLEEYLQKVIAWKPDLYIQEVVAPSYPYDVAVFDRLRKALPETLLAIAGTMVTGWGSPMLEKNPCFDVGLTYEWEETSLELASRLRDRLSLNGMSGLLHRADGKIIQEPRRHPPDLNLLPWPRRDNLPMLRYNDDFAYLPIPNLQMVTSRGCPYQCSFCVWIKARYGDRKVRFRDPDNVVDEILWCTANWPFKAVYFDDDTFNISREYILKLCMAMKSKGMKTPWAAMCRADLFDRETLTTCRESGLIAVKYGIESADQGIIDGVGKGLDLHKAEEVICLTRELGIKVHLTMIVGLPGETEQTLRKTWNFVKRIHADYLQFSLATPYPGTALYEQAGREGWIEARDWHEYNADSQAAMRTAAMSRIQLEAWIRKFNLLRFALQFRENPAASLKTYIRKAIQSPRKIRNAVKGLLGISS